ncbi:response regulator [Sphingobacterium sp.]|uniref:ATP-binding response regulator n=1 Tax=Sphingobacterium sp. TaxID=341027 RepID=UPI0031D9F3EC
MTKEIEIIDVTLQVENPTTKEKDSSGNFFLKYKWHFVFWVLYFIYSYTTDKIMMGDEMSCSREIILILTHHIFLFYSFLYCLRKFTTKDWQGLAFSIARFIAVVVIFQTIRIYLNASLFPYLFKTEGLQYVPLSPVALNIKATFYLIEFFIKSFAFFYFKKFADEQRHLREALIENYENQKIIEANKAKAERAEQVKQEYARLETTFINLVHETKTPLTLINNCLSEHISLNGKSPELEIAKKSINKVSRDISNLFDVERFKKGKEIYDHSQICNLSQIVTDTSALYSSYAKRKNIRISSNILPDLYTNADPAALNRVINNLLENAVKYSPGDTEINISLLSQADNLLFKIEDQGIGIDDDDLQKIFVPYLQLNKDKKNIQGLGLGLPLVKSILEELGSSLIINNKKADGTKGIVAQFSLRQVENAVIEAISGSYEYDVLLDQDAELSNIFHSEEHPNLLVVEDNLILNSYIVTKLGKKFNVKFALNGRDAINILKFEIPDLIISDVMMDQLDGFEMAKAITENPNYSHIPIIFLTARNSDKDKLHGLSLGAVDYIEKPFSLELLLNKVDSILALREKRDQKLFHAAYNSMKSLMKETGTMNIERANEVFESNCKVYNLTKTQIEIARLLIEGKTMKSIAADRNVSESTVESHRRNLYEKLAVSNKTELIKKLTT